MKLIDCGCGATPEVVQGYEYEPPVRIKTFQVVCQKCGMRCAVSYEPLNGKEGAVRNWNRARSLAIGNNNE